MSAPGGWTAYQLTEFLAALDRAGNTETAKQHAIDRAAEALECEVAALVPEQGNVISVGFPEKAVPTAELRSIVQAGDFDGGLLAVPGAGECHIAATGLRQERVSLLVARSTEKFSQEEENLLRGMGRVLDLTIASLRTVEELRERQALIERLSRIQRSISHRAGLQEVLDSIVAGAGELLGDEMVILRLIDVDDPRFTTIRSSYGLPPALLASTKRKPIGVGAAGEAMATGRLVVHDNYSKRQDAIQEFVEFGVDLVLSTPVYEAGEVIGCLVLAGRDPNRSYSSTECDVLHAFAEHASLALTDARTVEAVEQAYHDGLTGLANRTLFLDRLNHALANRDRREARVAVLFIDLDRFKIINDSLGHDAGDQVPVEVAKRIDGCVRGGDTAARLGGDEFAILLEQAVPGESVIDVIERILEALRPPHNVGNREIFLNASIGAAISDNASADGEELLRNADVAMYRAKNSKGAAYELFEPSMHTETLKRLELEADLQRAITGKEFKLFFQPIINLAEKRIVGAEALIRWQKPDGRVIAPDEFIELAEQTGLIIPIGRWVLLEACSHAKQWITETGNHSLKISVNLSPRQLLHPSIVEQVKESLEKTDLPAKNLMLEVTENALMFDPDAEVAKLKEIHRLGVTLAVDDFGTGYSSLSYLRQFPFEILKLAKPFVDGLARSKLDPALARGIIDLSRSLKLEVIAEGIEDPEQHEALNEMECRSGQGFYYGRPMPALPTETFPELASAILGDQHKKSGGRERVTVSVDEGSGPNIKE